MPVNNGDKIHKPPGHGDIGYIRRPDLVGPCYLHTVKQVGVYLVPRPRLARPGTPVDGFEPHQTHQPPDTFPVDGMSLPL